jgi:DNA-binding GntR family transcriptional regulator
MGTAAPVFLTGAAGALPSRTVAVLDAIKRAILTGELKPGQPLVETDLADRLGVSKTPVREALKNLDDGRVLLEPAALARSVANAHDWGAARDALSRAHSTTDLVERNLANRDFHAALYAGCGNPLLIGMLADLSDQTALVSMAFWRQNPTWECEAAEHLAMLEAAEAGDAASAAAILTDHISSTATSLRSAVT